MESQQEPQIIDQILFKVQSAWADLYRVGLERSLMGIGWSRGLLYCLEGIPLNAKNAKLGSLSDWALWQRAVKSYYRLLKRDAESVSSGLVPARVNLSNLFDMNHSLKWSRMLMLSLGSQKNLELNVKIRDYLKELPEAYRQDQRMQGYLDQNRADLLEYSTELVFRGAADAMRRLMIAPLKRVLNRSEGKGLRILEIGCGSGSLSRIIKLSFPRCKLVVLDLSYPLLKKSQENLREFERIDFIQGDAAELPFSDEKFDVVVSSFLFHEISLEARRSVLREMNRVLHKGGWVATVDLLQKEDAPDLMPLVDGSVSFAKDPAKDENYQSYRVNSLEGSFIHAGFMSQALHQGFISKVILFRLPIEEGSL